MAEISMQLSEQRPRAAQRAPVPAQLCNIGRLTDVMAERDVDGVVALMAANQYYLSSFLPHHSIPETDGLFPVLFSRHLPDHPIVLVADIDLAQLKFQPTWIRDVRIYASAVLHPAHVPTAQDMRPFMPAADFIEAHWNRPGASGFYPRATEAICSGLRDLGLDRGRIAFDNFATGRLLSAAFANLEAVPGDGLLRHARAGKTRVEIELLRRACAINQQALERTVAAWQPGMSWHDIQLTFQIEALRLGGSPNLPDTMGVGYSTVSGDALHADIICLDSEIHMGTNVMFDCHGKYNGYCWDGGKTWTVGGPPNPATRRHWRATFAVAREIERIARPGMPISALVDHGLETYRQCGVSSDGVLIFFHGLGLDHLDRDTSGGEKDWRLQPDMVFATHIYFPGDEQHRLFLEEIVLLSEQGNERLFTWDEEMLE
jgi:Xaa-Pro dipeptidase